MHLFFPFMQFDMSTLIFFLLLTKHIIFDYFLQTSWMIKDKAKYGAIGGLAHAGAHGLGTLAVLLFFTPTVFAIILSLVDSVLHYHIDYTKSTWMKRNNPSTNSQEYWIAHGLDQYAHILTYVLIILILTL